MEKNEIREFICGNIDFIKTREWYIDNETISYTIKIVKESKDANNELIKLGKSLIELYQNDKIKYKTELEKEMKDVKQRESFNRDTFIEIIKQYESHLKIRDVIEELIV